ncbi:MAG: DUF1566 domain-containing protein [Acidobacteriaceae bacterium]
MIILSTVGVVCGAQSTNDDDTLAKDTQARGYWADPSSGLMWAAKDNGKNVNWHQAVNYCHKLRVGGYADWRLATIDELEGLIDIKAFAPEHVGDSSILHFNIDGKVHGALLVTGREWSSSQRLDDRGKPVGIAWYFDFVNVRPSDDNGDIGLADSYDLRALCVRDSGENGSAEGAARSSPENPDQVQAAQAAATYSDPATGLMWTAKDNGKDVNLGEAVSYCRKLGLDGHSDWRLAKIEELEGMEAAGTAGKTGDGASSDRGSGRLALTGDAWSSSAVSNDLGYEPRFMWYLSMKSGTRVFDDPSFGRARRAVCVRDPSAQHGSRSGTEGSSPEQKTQERGTWTDPATGLMWAARDNLHGSRLYMDATNYCQKLRLTGHADWRLATIDELKGIYDPNAESPGANPRTDRDWPEGVLFHVKGNLFLTGPEWAKADENDDRNPETYRSLFDFKEGKPVSEKRYFVKAGALCVRGPGG